MKEIYNPSRPDTNNQSGVSLRLNEGSQQAVEAKASKEDGFLKHPPMQPKKEIGDYVEKNGIPTARRFEGHDEALEYVKSGGRIVIRSEHPDEYAGASGLLSSFFVDQVAIREYKEHCSKNGAHINWAKVHDNHYRYNAKQVILSQIETTPEPQLEQNLKILSFPDVEYYCRLTNQDVDAFYSQISYSYWQSVDGLNRSIIADSAIPGRYHIFANDPNVVFYRHGKEGFVNYSVVDNGKVIINSMDQMKGDFVGEIEFYNKVRNLENFDPNQCPIIEFQTDRKGQHHFLQYHRTRSVNPTTFTLDRGKRGNEFEAVHVRGATPTKDGRDYKIITQYSDFAKIKSLPLFGQDGSVLSHELRSPVFEEIMSRRNTVNIGSFDNLDSLAYNSRDTHAPKSYLFNSDIFVAVPYKKLPRFKRLEKGEIQMVDCHITSDGRRSYVQIEE